MKHITLAAFGCLSLLAAAPLHAQTLTPQLAATVGSGSNESFLVLDFENGASPTVDNVYAFGYRYDLPPGGGLTGTDMLNALINANIGLTDTTTVYSFGTAIDSFTYQGDTAGGFQSTGYWNYWLSNDGQNWTLSSVGASDRTLSNGSYDGWAWDLGTDTVPHTPFAATAVPEASASWLLLLGLPLALFARRRRSA